MNGEKDSFASNPGQASLGTISLRNLLKKNYPQGLSSCQFVLGNEVHRNAKPEVPEIKGVFSVSGEPTANDPKFGIPLGGIAFRDFVDLLGSVKFTVTDEDLNSGATYILHPKKLTDTPALNTVINNCSLLDISMLVQNYVFQVEDSNRHLSESYKVALEHCSMHANTELRSPMDQLGLDSVVTYLSLFNFPLEARILGTGVQCLYGNKVHGL